MPQHNSILSKRQDFCVTAGTDPRETLETLETLETPAGDLFSRVPPGKQPIWPQFIAFDLLWRDGESLLAEPLTTRRRLLAEVIGAGTMQLAPVQTTGALAAALQLALRDGHHGLIAKNPGSAYAPATRSGAWIRVRA